MSVNLILWIVALVLTLASAFGKLPDWPATLVVLVILLMLGVR